MKPVFRRGFIIAALCLFSAAQTAHAASHVPTPDLSGITRVDVTAVQDLGLLNGVPYSRVIGVVMGRVAPTENVVGLDAQPRDADGYVTWNAQFEVIRPTAGDHFRMAVVEAENRSNPLMIQLFNRFLGGAGPPSKATYPAGLGDGFLFDGGRAYARVQWQTGVAAGVPANAQGLGLIALRDFGRLLRDGKVVGGAATSLGSYDHRIITGWSQGAWMTNTFVAEGFNVDPQRQGQGVYDGAIALAGAGNWLAVNQLGNDGRPEDPYLRPEAAPLRPSAMLMRQATDPYFVDIATYTDFYRLRAGTSEGVPAPSVKAYRRYEWPAAHGPSFFVTNALVFQVLGCNSGQVVPLSPLDFRPYLRAVLSNLDEVLSRRGVVTDLPPSVRFELGPQPPPSPYFNGLANEPVPVPLTDSDSQPVGGVRYPEVVYPLGRLEPVSLPPVSTVNINALCGNIGGYAPFTRDEVLQRYGSVDQYLALVTPQIDALIASGLVLPRDRDWMIDAARVAFLAAVGP